MKPTKGRCPASCYLEHAVANARTTRYARTKGSFAAAGSSSYEGGRHPYGRWTRSMTSILARFTRRSDGRGRAISDMASRKRRARLSDMQYRNWCLSMPK